MQCGHTLAQAAIRCDCCTDAAVDISYWKRVRHGMTAYDSVQKSTSISYVSRVSAVIFARHIYDMVWYDIWYMAERSQPFHYILRICLIVIYMARYGIIDGHIYMAHVVICSFHICTNIWQNMRR